MISDKFADSILLLPFTGGCKFWFVGLKLSLRWDPMSVYRLLSGSKTALPTVDYLLTFYYPNLNLALVMLVDD